MKVLLHYFLVVSTAFLFSAADLHEFHLSKSTVNYDSASNSLQVTMHIFIDDLEVALAETSAPKLYIGTEKEDSTADSYISTYITDHFAIAIGNDTLSQHFLGKELSEDLQAIWCYLEIPLASMPGKVSFSNGILMEVYPDQKNVVSWKVDKKRIDDFLLEKDDYAASVDLY